MMERTAVSKGVRSGAECAFDALLCDSIIDVFKGTLGKIACQALLDALKLRTSLEIEDIAGNPDLLDQALRANLGSVAAVLERAILKTLSKKTAAGAPPSETTRFDFSLEVEKLRKEFLKRKQARGQPQTLE